MRLAIATPGSARRSEAGMMLVELLAAVVLMSVVAFGLITIMVVQARQVSRDKLLADMDTYAQYVLTEAEYSLGTAKEVIRSGNTGARTKEDLEFNFMGSLNFGYEQETRFSQEGERKVDIRVNGAQVVGAQRFPPLAIDPNRTREPKYRIYVRGLRFTNYNDRPFVNATVASMLYEVNLVLELSEFGADSRTPTYSIERSYRRVITAPNVQITRSRLSQSAGS